jgi:tetracycline resistance efflux pump
MVDNGLGDSGTGIAQFIKTIPYNFYAWAAVLIVPLVITGVIPIFGPMKAAEKGPRRQAYWLLRVQKKST